MAFIAMKQAAPIAGRAQRENASIAGKSLKCKDQDKSFALFLAMQRIGTWMKTRSKKIVFTNRPEKQGSFEKGDEMTVHVLEYLLFILRACKSMNT
jgi:hypothetical protein